MALQSRRNFGNYHVVRLIGEGAFGEVYLAENLFLVPDEAAPGGERVKLLDFGIAKVKRGGAHQLESRLPALCTTQHSHRHVEVDSSWTEGVATLSVRTDELNGCGGHSRVVSVLPLAH